MNGKYFYDGLDVLDGEFTAVEEKYGLNREDFKEGNIREELRDKVKTYFQNEASFLEADLKDDETLGNRFDVAAEDENGELWIYIKAFNINRWQKLFGTEPE